jgi:hypothetical protein
MEDEEGEQTDKYAEQRRDGVLLRVIQVCRMRQSAVAEMHKKRNGALNGHGAQRIKGIRTKSVRHVCMKTVRQTEQGSVVEK